MECSECSSNGTIPQCFMVQSPSYRVICTETKFYLHHTYRGESMSAIQRHFLVPLAIALIFVVTACQPAKPGQSTSVPLTAVVKEVQGKADFKQAGGGGFLPASVGAVLQGNSSIQNRHRSPGPICLF